MKRNLPRSEGLRENLQVLLSRRTPQGLLILSFAGLILLGSVLLSLPIAHASGAVGYVDALFTATSAVCVTGLIVVDTATDYTLFGQIVILVLIQAGGLGVMTFAALVFRLMGRRLSLSSRAALHDAFFQEDRAGEFRRLFARILRITLLIETAGALALFLALVRRTSAGDAAYSAVFHSISAFCNAGFSIYTDNLYELRESVVIVSAVMVLIILGGLGHTVLQELSSRLGAWTKRGGPRRGSVARSVDLGGRTPDGGTAADPPAPGDSRRLRPLSLHTQVVLRATLVLIVGGTILLFLFGMTGEQTSWSSRLWTALFQSVTARTAGFNTVSIGMLPYASLLLLCILMFIGGSPGSCAGGLKTTTAAIWVARLRARLAGDDEPRLLGRRVPNEVLRRTTILVALAVIWNTVGVLLLLATELGTTGPFAFGLQDVLFEQLSAFGTVGLSTGLTPVLSTAGRVWIIATMFVGRLGPLTLATWMVSRDTIRVRYPEGKVMIG